MKFGTDVICKTYNILAVENCFAMVMACDGQNVGENPSWANYFLNVQTILWEFMINVCRGVYM